MRDKVTPSSSIQKPAIMSLSGIIDENGTVDPMDEDVSPSRHMTVAAQARLPLAELEVVHLSAVTRRKILIDREREVKLAPPD